MLIIRERGGLIRSFVDREIFVVERMDSNYDGSETFACRWRCKFQLSLIHGTGTTYRAAETLRPN